MLVAFNFLLRISYLFTLAESIFVFIFPFIEIHVSLTQQQQKMNNSKLALISIIFGCLCILAYPFPLSIETVINPRNTILCQSEPFLLRSNSIKFAACSIKKRSISYLLSTSSELKTGSSYNQDEEIEETKDTEDHAPCFDSICVSNPELMTNDSEDTNDGSIDRKSSVGEATLRLGEATGPTVWSEFGRLAQENKVSNLGQGFPDWLPPQFAVDSLVEAATDTIDKSPHQYTRTAGHVRLVKMLAKRYSAHLKRKVDPMNEVAVTVGASQALYISLQTLIKPGEHFVFFAPQ